MSLSRYVRHLSTGTVAVRRAFPPAALSAIETAVRESECTHSGEIRFAAEAALSLDELRRGQTPRQRAIEVFGELGIWDTDERNGVLIYLLLADRDVEIVADRGIAAHVAAAEWEAICHRMESAFGRRDFTAGAVEGVRAVGELLARHYPCATRDPNQLPDRPVVM